MQSETAAVTHPGIAAAAGDGAARCNEWRRSDADEIFNEFFANAGAARDAR